MADLLSLMVEEVYQQRHLTKLFWIAESLINFISFVELFAKVLRRCMNCLLVNNRLCIKPGLSVPINISIMPDDNLKVGSVGFFRCTL